MEGLCKLGTSLEFPLTFDGRGVEFPAVTIITALNGSQTKIQHTILKETDLPSFFHDDPSTLTPSLRLASIPVSGPGHILISRTTFEATLRAIGVDPWVEHHLRTLPYGFHHSDKIASPGFLPTYFLGTSFVWSLWTTQYLIPSQSFTTKCLILNPAGARFSTTSAANLAVGGESFRHLTAFFRALDAFKGDAHSALCLPFVFTVNAFRWREQSILSVLDVVRMVEIKTGHGSWGSGRFQEKREGITELTANLGQAGNTVGNTVKHLGIMREVLDYLEAVEVGIRVERAERNESVRGSDESIVRAVRTLTRQCASLREQCRYLEGRIRNQSSVLFAFLTHEDSKINIEVANASKALAEATARDSSSMKTIAILTMAFLPATFFAALFSVPSLGWSEPDKFSLYWACTVSVTLGTFVLWVALTQREALKVVFDSCGIHFMSS
ncbi:hypothetical protein QBC43DRAFT_325777 [Cladorrhinum sp. PSN259]|nr:hypothetical protein QBC43DRAFT_325777 [Cladorrhinum sp. PSN259]